MDFQDLKLKRTEESKCPNEDSLTFHYPLKLHWVFGYCCDVPPINISSATIKGVYFTSGCIGVCYDWVRKTQTLLFGHVGNIVFTISTSDRSYLASVDSGVDASLIIWHRTGKVIFTVNGYFCEKTVVWMCFSEDGNKILTLTEETPQELAIWDWRTKNEVPSQIHKFKVEDEFQHNATFHLKSSSHVISCSKENVFFFKLDRDKITSSHLNIHSLYDKKVCKKIGEFTRTVFSPLSSLAYTATTKGMLVLWGLSHYRKDKSRLSVQSDFLEPSERTCLRAIQVLESRTSISYLGLFKNFIIIGTYDSEVCWLDETFKLVRSIKIMEGPISTVSFNIIPRFTMKEIVYRVMGVDVDGESLKKPDFIVSTKTGYTCYVSFKTSKITPVIHGTPHSVKSIAVHPISPYLYMGDSCGTLMKWNYTTKDLLSKDVFQRNNNQIECMTIDSNGIYIACGLGISGIAIFEAVSLSGKPLYVLEDVHYKSKFIKFSPDPQHLIVVDEAAFVSWFQLHLLVPPEFFQMLKKPNIPLEEPSWIFKAKNRHHQGHILDIMFNQPAKNESIFFFTLGEDCCVIQYNLTNSKKNHIEVTKTINLTWNSSPLCICWYSVYGLNDCFAVISNDGKMCVYDLITEKILNIVVMPQYNESFKKALLLKKPDDVHEDYVHCLTFMTENLIGLSKYPIDGNPYSSMAVKTHPNGIHTFITNKEESFIFTTGMNDSWIHMYKIDSDVLKREEGGLDDFKCLFPTNEDAEEMKRRIILSVYSLEQEMKLLTLGDTKPDLTGKIPASFIEYVFSALGCFMPREDLEMMMNHIKLELAYRRSDETLNALDIMKYYINYRPLKPLSIKSIREAFREVALDESTDSIPRGRFGILMETGDDMISKSELFDIVKCLRDKKPKNESLKNNPKQIELKGSSALKKQTKAEDLLPDPITEEVFMHDLLGFGEVEEDLSTYVLKKSDRKLMQERPKLEEFVIAITESNLLRD